MEATGGQQQKTTRPRVDLGELSMQISREMVILMKDYLGRGPTRARTYIRDNMVVVILQDTMTKAERALTEDGKGDAVRQVRREFQETLRAETVRALEKLMDRKVLTFLSDHDVKTDMACEVFVLEPVPEDGPENHIESETEQD